MFKVFAYSLLLLFPNLWITASDSGQRVSSFGQYKGYSGEIYTGWQRSSQYVTVRDGTKLAVDIVRPTLNDKLVTEKLPVIWTHTRYHRAFFHEGKAKNVVDMNPNYQTFVKHGYVMAIVDVRGGGASFGTHAHAFADVEAKDSYDITQWLAEQPWSSGKIGMVGASYLGITQFFAAAEAPPALKAILPRKALTDMYDFVWPGGIYRHDFLWEWQNITRFLDTQQPAVPVDEDTDGTMLKQAIAEHQANGNIYELYRKMPHRNSEHEGASLNSPLHHLDAINRSGVAIYQWAGWFDTWPKDAIIFHQNLKTPSRLIIGNWFHQTGQESYVFIPEHLRWMDYHLKGIENGVQNDNPIHYEVIDAPESQAWRSSKVWPPKHVEETTYYLNAGDLSTKKGEDGKDTYTIDYTTTSGKPSRWSNGYGHGGPNVQVQDMQENDKKALTYTSGPLKEAVEVIGHPVAHLWLQTKATDLDIYLYLEEVAPDGTSLYVTEGQLRTSHRKLAEAPHDYLGLPWSSSHPKHMVEMDGKPTKLSFDLLPTAKRFRKGHSIRVSITGADTDNYEVVVLDPSPEIFLIREGVKRSVIILPIAKPSD